jgi:hypothetical protein
MRQRVTVTFEQRNSQQASVESDERRLEKMKRDVNDLFRILEAALNPLDEMERIKSLTGAEAVA